MPTLQVGYCNCKLINQTIMPNTWLDKLSARAPRSEWQQLAIEVELADELRTQAFGITPKNVTEVIQERAYLLHSVYPAFTQFCQNVLQLQPRQLLEILWNLWLPLAIQIASCRQQLNRPFVQGILGGQGTGKTTLGAVLNLILHQLGYCTLSLSLDDLYKTYSDRMKLKEQDPRLIWRGPPGTHDVDLGLALLDRLRMPSNAPIEIPRFDKSAYSGAGDRATPEVVERADIVLFEGWFVGVRPIEAGSFDTALVPILTSDDREFARDTNIRLKDYLPLWERLDRLIVLYPVDYRLSVEWRKQAEHKMIAAGRAGMTDGEIEQFVNYFWRSLHPELFIKPLIDNPNWVDLVIEINPDRSTGAVYQPSGR